MVTAIARWRALASAGLVGAHLLAGYAAGPAGSANGVGVPRLRNDLGVNAAVTICADASCRQPPSTVAKRLTSGAFLPVNMTVGVDHYRLVEVSGAAARCHRVPTNPSASEPTAALSDATACEAPVQAAIAKAAASPARRALEWLALIPLLAVSGLLWWIIWFATRDAYRFLRRRIGPVAAFTLCAAALLLGAWLLALPYWVGKQVLRAFAKLRHGQPV